MLSKVALTSPRSARRRSAASALTAVALVASLAACTGGDEPSDAQPDAGQAAAGGTPSPAPPTPPSPSEELGLTEDWGPDRAELDRAARLVERLSLPQLAGQLIVAEWRGTTAPVAMVRDLHLGGVIAFDSNVVSAAQVKGVNAALSRRAGRKWPLFLGVDQEGGVVERLRGAATRFPTFMSAGAANDAALTRTAYAASGAELRGLGFTVDFAPDADVTSGPGDPTIGSRSPSSRPRAVSEHVIAAAEGFTSSGVLPVIKHFPGHGSVPVDSHLTLPVQAKTRAALDESDLVPFRAAVEAGLPAVMVGHLDVRAVDPRVPSSLSRKVVTDLLRTELGFTGLVVTDSLAMAAVTRGRDAGRTAVQALRAGSDVLLMPPSPAAARAAVVRAVRSGELIISGKVGGEVTAEEAYACAQQCVLNAIAAIKAEVGELSRVRRVVKVVAFVASTPDFTGQPGVANGASELLGQVFGEAGVHARSAVGVPVLPLDAPVEVELLVEVADGSA